MRAEGSRYPMRTIQATALLLVLLPGCARFDLRRNIPWQQEPEGPPASVVAFWTDAVLERTGGPPYRGFGGRILFYSRDLTRSIRARGTLVVYAFNDDLPPPENLKPVRKFVFTAEQLAQMESESNMGPSYSVLVPWDQFSPEPQRLSLMVRLIPESGGSVISEQARVFLPGLANPDLASPKTHSPDTYAGVRTAAGFTSKDSAGRNHIQQASYADVIPFHGGTLNGSDATSSLSRSRSGTDAGPRRRMQTMTLNLGSRAPLGQVTEPGPASPPRTSTAASDATRSKENYSLGVRNADFGANALISMESASEAPHQPPPSMREWENPAGGFTTPPTPGQMIMETVQRPSNDFRPAQYPVPTGLAAPPPIDPGRMGQSLGAPRFDLGR
ncbi:MAG: hypothetical protein Kow0040_04990 [Thermogutta sp.]